MIKRHYTADESLLREAEARSAASDSRGRIGLLGPLQDGVTSGGAASNDCPQTTSHTSEKRWS